MKYFLPLFFALTWTISALAASLASYPITGPELPDTILITHYPLGNTNNPQTANLSVTNMGVTPITASDTNNIYFAWTGNTEINNATNELGFYFGYNTNVIGGRSYTNSNPLGYGAWLTISNNGTGELILFEDQLNNSLAGYVLSSPDLKSWYYASNGACSFTPPVLNFLAAADMSLVATSTYHLAITGWLTAGSSSSGSNATSAVYAGVATNVVSGISITNAYITNSVFAGNGSGLTGTASGLTAGNLSGTITASQVTGPITASNLSGTITASQVTGPITASNLSGTISVTQVIGIVGAGNIPAGTTITNGTGTNTVLGDGGWTMFPVPYLEPAMANLSGVLDVMSSGQSSPSWIDIGTPYNISVNGQYLSLGLSPGNYACLESKGLGTSNGVPLVLQGPPGSPNGGNVNSETGVYNLPDRRFSLIFSDGNASGMDCVNTDTGGSSYAKIEVKNTTNGPDGLEIGSFTNWSGGTVGPFGPGVVTLRSFKTNGFSFVTAIGGAGIRFYTGGYANSNLSFAINTNGTTVANGNLSVTSGSFLLYSNPPPLCPPNATALWNSNNIGLWIIRNGTTNLFF